MSPDIGRTLIASLNNALYGITNFVPTFVLGAIILLVGIILASVCKQIILELFKVINFDTFLRKYGVPEGKDELNWANILAEIGRWFVIIVFLIPTADVWGLPQVIAVLNTFLFYIPNVFVAAIIALVGFVFARLAHDVVLASVKGVSPDVSHAIASVVRWAIIVFVLLAVLNQLGVAAELVRILFTGFVAMVAIAGGIAFGLGGQGVAKDVLESIKRKLK